ncbi:ammonia-dependent NAD(+) synthetase [Ciceribacter ferrooxidans]|uniref:NH(3)-dependent NAD(+) synthetase n=1 Tax=Ciceribacter ferrooxidans TaxID=2509717 RepID=A0A4Q2SBE5_9HYPH|nr:ammonia-dependent NAD(+) synthetase [Ciceribacter ferrooxidans]RYB98577.1 ammonia-dependent NAD(+) synthetase [Ciceribacter ferrooxidans]
MTNQQLDIIRALGVSVTFDPGLEIERRIAFLSDYLKAAGGRAYVLGISGGVDSLTAGLLAQAAASRLRETGYDAQFLAMRLPYGRQADESDAQNALATICPDRTVTVNIKSAADAIMDELRGRAGGFSETAREDFHHGNIKARQRMIAQYALASSVGGLVVGTDHAAEALMGFFTKFGDGAADVLPLSGLNKRRIRTIALLLGAPQTLVFKTPTADLETNAPLRPDEDAYGLSYEEIDDFLEGKVIGRSAHARILEFYRTTAHKRAPPVAPENFSPSSRGSCRT